MNAEQTNQAVREALLAQLKADLPRAQFENWVRDIEIQPAGQEVFIIATRNAYARDWLESRMTDRIQSILSRLAGRSISIRFVARSAEVEQPQAAEEEVGIEPVQWLDYDRIVQPHRQVVVKGYLRRLGMEIGPKAVWLYIGFHQAAWAMHTAENQTLPLYSRQVMRFSSISSGAFWRLLAQAGVQSQLNGLVQRIDPPAQRTYHRGRDGRPHRVPIRYRVFMTPRLTRADAQAVYFALKNLLEQGRSLLQALQELLAVDDPMDLLRPVESANPALQLNSVMDMARFEAGSSYSSDVDHLAQELHRRIVNCLGDIHIPHYFITDTIRKYNLTPAQAWLVTVARDMAYVNARTGERRETVTFRNGYLEMARLCGSGRYKTIQAWLSPQWKTQKRGGDLSSFLVELERSPATPYLDLRVESMARTFRVLLDEPLDADGGNMAGADGAIMTGADGGNRQTQMGLIADAGGGNMADANGTDLSSLKHPLNTVKKNTSATQHAHGAKRTEQAPPHWELKQLLSQNEVHPKVQKELLEVQASVHAFVSWVLYAASPHSGQLADPLGYAISRLREHPLREARGVFRKLADLPPCELLALINSTPSKPYQIPAQALHPLASEWIKGMGASNPRLPAVREILFCGGEDE